MGEPQVHKYIPSMKQCHSVNIFRDSLLVTNELPDMGTGYYCLNQ